MAKKVVALFVEGPTEIEFYKAVINRARSLMKVPYDCLIEYVDMRGIGNYKKDAERKFNNLKKKYEGTDIVLFLCIDSDVFEYSKKPPIDRTQVAKSLKSAGAQSVTYIIAKTSIEEWFLSDLSGVLDYLRLPASTKRPKGNGQEALSKLFKTAKKVYLKGGKTEGFIERLNIGKISKTYCSSLKPLCNALGIQCDKVCGSDE